MDDELLKEFFNESREHLATIEADLLAIEEAGANLDEDLVNKVFRAAHSIKGGSSFFGLTKVKELAHKAETILDMLRSRKMTPNAEVTNVLLAAFDKLRDMINNPAERESADTSELLISLTGLASSYLPQDQKASLTQNVSLKDGKNSVTLPQVDVDRARRQGQCVYSVSYDLIHDIEKKGLNVLQIFRELAESGEVLDCQMDFDAVGTLDSSLGNQLPLKLILATSLGPEIVHELVMVPKEKITLLFDPAAQPAAPASAPVAASPAPAPVAAHAPSEPVAPAEPEPKAAAEPKPEAPAPAQPAVARSASEHAASQTTADETLRVSVRLLEGLMNLAGELVLSRNQLRAAVAQQDMQSLTVADQRLNQVTSELQDAIMRTRLQPIGNVFGKFPRVVRDMANSLRKEIQLDIQGKDVALDRSLIEGLSDPLTHMVRNAVDHGIEKPDDRIKCGKKPQGTIRIEARHEAGQVVVEISDDGKGINPNRVAEAAIKKGLITAEKVRGLSEQEKVALIFLPGLSTAEKVTDLSGRGVGMDVVKTNLDRLGGKVEIKSEVGKGSQFRIKLPLTLAIIPSLIVSVVKERFAIPQINVEELLRIRAEEVKKRIEVVSGAEVLRLREQIMPLLHLDRLLGVTAAGQAAQAEALDIAVLTTGSMRYGLVVSAFHETEEIVVKPLGQHLKGLREYAGATILGDGTVALILDIAGVAAKADYAAVNSASRSEEQDEENEKARLEDTQSLLLFHNAPGEVCATPLDTVLRIERITPERVEIMGGRRTMQYRGASLPLVTLSDAAQVQSLGETRDLAVIVANVRGREVGLLGAMPVDVVESKAEIDASTHRQKGICGSAIIRDKTTLIADVFELVDTVYPEWSQPAVEQMPAQDLSVPLAGGANGASQGEPKARITLLLAEDSDFFRAQVKKYLEQDGYQVLDAPDGQAAWELLEQRYAEINGVVTDIEMPRLTGLGLAQRIRGDERVSRLPIMALSSLAGEEDVAKGKAAGVTEYLVKLDRDQLLASVHTFIGAA